MLTIIPQKFQFVEPAIENHFGEIISGGISVEISLDMQNADKKKVKEQLETIFGQVLEYFR